MMHLACIADGGYARHTGAMLHSALARSMPMRVAVHVLHETPLGEGDTRNLRTVTDAFDASLELHRLPRARVADFPSGYFPRSIWFRALLPELLPAADKVLYLDSDLIVADDLAPLWETDLGDALLGAVVNPFYPFMHFHAPGRPEDYFNSGVLLMNLARMRAESTAAKLYDYARTHPSAHYPDQDAYNAVCEGRWLRLHPRWNAQSTFFELRDADLPLPPQQVIEARSRPAIVHFIGPFKPWSYLCRHPLQAKYFEHARKTPWGEPELEGRSLRNAVLRRLPLEWIDRWFAAERRAARLWRRAVGA